jgi:protein ImuB
MLDAPTRVVIVQFPRWSSFAVALGRGARSAFEPVVQAVVAHAPLVEVTAPGIIVFATRGPSRYVGGDERLAALVQAAVRDAVHRMVAAARGTVIDEALVAFGVGVADGRLAAGVASSCALQSGRPFVVASAESARWLATSPVRALVECVDVIGAVAGVARTAVPGIDDVASYRDIVSLLERLGLYRFGDVAALSEADLIARFGAFGRDLSRLSRGLDRHPPLAVAPPPDRVCTRQFDAPVESRDIVVAAVDELAAALVAHLAAHGLAMVHLHVLIESDHGERSERMWYRADGFSARAVVESLRWQLDAWITNDAPTSGVVSVRLSPEQLVVDAGRQAALWGGERDGDRQAQRAVRRVADMNGAESVTVPAWRGDRDPARSFEFVRSDTVDLERRAAGDTRDLAARDWRGALPSPSPSIVFDTADASPGATTQIGVLDAAGRAVTVDARHAMSGEPARVRIGDDTFVVVAWAGPWPLEERWWDVRRARRAVRLQLLVRPNGEARGVGEARVAHTAMVVVLERRAWRLAAWYA